MSWGTWGWWHLFPAGFSSLSGNNASWLGHLSWDLAIMVLWGSVPDPVKWDGDLASELCSRPPHPPLFGIPRTDAGDARFCQGKSKPHCRWTQVPSPQRIAHGIWLGIGKRRRRWESGFLACGFLNLGVVLDSLLQHHPQCPVHKKF